MVTNGAVYSEYAKDSCLYVHWNAVETDTDKNRTKIEWAAGVWTSKGNLWYTNAVIIDSIYIDGGDSLGAGSYSDITSDGYHQKLSGYKWIYHNDDGTKEISVSISGRFYALDGGYVNKAGSDTFTLNVIDRISGVFVTSGNIGSPLNISIDRKSSSCIHSLEYYFGNLAESIPMDGDETSIQWTPSMDLCYQIPNDTHGKCSVVCRTYNSNNIEIGHSSCDIELSVPEWVNLMPNSTCGTVVACNSGGAEAVNDFVKGYSRAEVKFIPENIDKSNAYGAKTKSLYISFEGIDYKNSPYRTMPISTSGNKNITCYVVDTRDRVTSFVLSFYVNDYYSPTLSDVSVFRCDQHGNANDSGTYISVSAIATYVDIAGNQITFDVGYAKNGEAIKDSNRRHITSGSAIILGDGDISPDCTYKIEIRLVDAFKKGVIHIDYVPTEKVFFRGGKGGNSAGFGKSPEGDYLLDVAWDLRTRGELFIGDGDDSIADFVKQKGQLECSPVKNNADNSESTDKATWNYALWKSGKVELWSVQAIDSGDYSDITTGICGANFTVPLPITFPNTKYFVSVSVVGFLGREWACISGTGLDEFYVTLLRAFANNLSFPIELKVHIIGHFNGQIQKGNKE